EEFSGPSAGTEGTHRLLAQAALKVAGSFFGYDLAVFNALTRPHRHTVAAIRKVCDGYGINQSMDERKLFCALGFHLGSELLADEEFRILDNFLRANHPDLVDFMESTGVPGASEQTTDAPNKAVQTGAYVWIRI